MFVAVRITVAVLAWLRWAHKFLVRRMVKKSGENDK